MQINFISPVLFVTDMNQAKEFYTQVLGQSISMDSEKYVVFKAGFSLWQGDLAYSMIYEKKRHYAAGDKNKQFEVYFETDTLDQVWEKLRTVPGIIHAVHEHPWGQRGFRISDPDGHIVEISEPMPIVIKRLQKEGLSLDEIARKTSFPVSMVREMVE